MKCFAGENLDSSLLPSSFSDRLIACSSYRLWSFLLTFFLPTTLPHTTPIYSLQMREEGRMGAGRSHFWPWVEVKLHQILLEQTGFNHAIICVQRWIFSCCIKILIHCIWCLCILSHESPWSEWHNFEQKRVLLRKPIRSSLKHGLFSFLVNPNLDQTGEGRDKGDLITILRAWLHYCKCGNHTILELHLQI